MHYNFRGGGGGGGRIERAAPPGAGTSGPSRTAGTSVTSGARAATEHAATAHANARSGRLPVRRLADMAFMAARPCRAAA